MRFRSQHQDPFRKGLCSLGAITIVGLWLTARPARYRVLCLIENSDVQVVSGTGID